MFIDNMKLNNNNGFKIIDFKGISFMKEGSYVLKY